MLPLTRIIATLGPASSSPEIIGRLIEEGVSIFRLNFSHGTPEEQAERGETIRAVATTLDRPTAILGDLPGAKIRVGAVAGDGIDLASGETVLIQRAAARARAGEEPVRLSSTYEDLVDDLEPGNRVLINDGLVRLLVVERTGDVVDCRVTHGGLVTSGKGMHMPDSNLKLPSLTERDWAWAEWALRHEIDFVGMSFVRRAEEIAELRQGMADRRRRLGLDAPVPPVVAKIEQPAAVDNLEAIVGVADAVMIARGDLGVEMDLVRVPVIQKKIIETAHAHGRPCIVATQMLESMIRNPVPTRAEASDVAHAIFDDVDAVMLSGETAVGRYPVLTVSIMRGIAEQAEAWTAARPSRSSPPRKLVESRHPMAALAHGLWNVARDCGARCVVVWSQSGAGARHLSQNNFRIPVVAVSSDPRALRRMQLLRGVIPVRMDVPGDLDEFARRIDAWMLDAGIARRGQACLLVAGAPIGAEGVTNSLVIHNVGSHDAP